MSRHDWAHYSTHKAKIVRYCFLPEMLLIKEPCNVIGEEPILVYILKLCVSNWSKKAFVYLKIQYFFVLNYFLHRNANKTTLWNPCYLKASLGMPKYVWIHPTKSRYLTCYLSLLDICHVRNQRNWCTTSRYIFDQRIQKSDWTRKNWPLICGPGLFQEWGMDMETRNYNVFHFM